MFIEQGNTAMYTNEKPVATLRVNDGLWFVRFNRAAIFGPQCEHEYSCNYYGGRYRVAYDPEINFGFIASDILRRFPTATVIMGEGRNASL